VLVLRGNRVGVAEDVKDWWDVCWDLTCGCTKASTECQNCSAAVMYGRIPHMAKYVTARDPHTADWTGVIETFPKALEDAKRWPPGQVVFAGALSDLFHSAVPEEFLEQVIAAVYAHPEHTFGFLTKRAERMAEFFRWRKVPENAWLGVSVSAPAFFDRVAALRRIDAPVKWVSAEPLLTPLPLPSGIDWLVAGPELGVNARAYDISWFRALRDECAAEGVPFFMKHQLDGVEHREYPR